MGIGLNIEPITSQDTSDTDVLLYYPYGEHFAFYLSFIQISPFPLCLQNIALRDGSINFINTPKGARGGGLHFQEEHKALIYTPY